MSARKQRAHRFRLRFYLILLVPILLVGAYIGYRILNPTTGRLGTDTVEGDLEFTGVIIRRENMATSKDGEGQRSLACCSPWGHKELDMT